MSIVLVVSIIVALVSILIIEILTKAKKIEYKSKVYNSSYFWGVYIPIIILILSFSYVYTDTLIDFIRVGVSLVLVLNIIYFNDKYLMKSKYYWIIAPIIILTSFGCFTFASRYLLSDFYNGVFYGVIGGFFVSGFKKTNYKKMIISSIFTIIVILIILVSFPSELLNISKPIRYAVNRVQNEGFEISNGDSISRMSYLKQNRYQPIGIYVMRVKDGSIERYFELIYFENEIIDFKERYEFKEK